MNLIGFDSGEFLLTDALSGNEAKKCTEFSAGEIMNSKRSDNSLENSKSNSVMNGL